MITLPKNRVDNEERIKNGVDTIMSYVCEQINYCHSHDKSSDVVAIVKSGSDYSKCRCNGVMEEWFPNDLIARAMQEVKSQGYYVWYDNDYMGRFTYWITETNNCPHTWFSKF